MNELQPRELVYPGPAGMTAGVLEMTQTKIKFVVKPRFGPCYYETYSLTGLVPKVIVYRPGPCAKPCCYRHERELADDFQICMGHWEMRTL